VSRVAGLLAAVLLAGVERSPGEAAEPRPHVAVRGIYGGVPQEILDSGRSLAEFGIDAVWMGSGSFTPERMALLRAQGVRAFAEFNTLHVAEYLKDHPDAAPIGPDGRVSPPPDGHARFGHAAEPEWISRQVAWLGRHLGIEGVPGERHRIWPIVQISDWGEPVRLEQVPAVLDHGSRRPATGVMVFAWGGLRKQPEKIEAIGRAFRGMRRRE